MPAFTVIGDPTLNRTQLFIDAARAAGVDAEVCSYLDILGDKDGWREKLHDRLVRIETPGRDFEVDIGIRRLGASLCDDTPFSRYSSEELATLKCDAGRIFGTRQWYVGLIELLSKIQAAALRSGAQFMNRPQDIITMFDKSSCHQELQLAGAPVPRALPTPPKDFESLMAALHAENWTRAFLKPRYGSAGNGVVALAFSGDKMVATTAVQVAGSGDKSFLYAGSKLRPYTRRPEIERLINTLCREPLHVEEWVPKAGFAGRTFDIRVVTIRGRACHLMLRRSKGPITNLHLDAEKGSEELLKENAGSDAVALVRATAESVAAHFKKSLYMGIDIALTPTFKRAVVLEVNAFGDLLEGVQWRGGDTYTWEIRAALDRDWPPAP